MFRARADIAELDDASSGEQEKASGFMLFLILQGMKFIVDNIESLLSNRIKKCLFLFLRQI